MVAILYNKLLKANSCLQMGQVLWSLNHLCAHGKQNKWVSWQSRQTSFDPTAASSLHTGHSSPAVISSAVNVSKFCILSRVRPLGGGGGRIASLLSGETGSILLFFLCTGLLRLLSKNLSVAWWIRNLSWLTLTSSLGGNLRGLSASLGFSLWCTSASSLLTSR